MTEIVTYIVLAVYHQDTTQNVDVVNITKRCKNEKNETISASKSVDVCIIELIISKSERFL